VIVETFKVRGPKKKEGASGRGQRRKKERIDAEDIRRWTAIGCGGGFGDR